MVGQSLTFKIGEITLNVMSIDSVIDLWFKKICELHIFGKPFDLLAFKKAFFDFLDKTDYIKQDNFFSNFTSVWQIYILEQNFMKSENLWAWCLSLVYEWEDITKKRAHKGTLYYFYGITCILHNDFSKGFLLMHQALEEDKLTTDQQRPDSPAFSFVTLNYTKSEQFFKEKVVELANFVDQKIQTYYNSRNGSINLSEFQSKFLNNVDVQEIVFYFVFTIFRLKHQFGLDGILIQNTFGSLNSAKLLFDLCLVIDSLMKKKNSSGTYFSDHITYLSKKFNLVLNEDRLKTELGHDGFMENFSDTAQKLLAGTYVFKDGTSLSVLEEDIALAYGFRNFGAHKIENQPVINKNFVDISQRILNVLFFCIEKLY